MSSSTTWCSSSRKVQRARPFGGLEHASAISRASFSPRHRRPRPLLAAQNGLKALLNQLLACPIHRCSAGLQRLDDPAVAPSFASIRNVGLQQYPRLHQPLGRAFAFADHLVELLALVLAQPHHILLYRNRLASHDRPPSRLIATKGNQTFLSNSLKPATSRNHASRGAFLRAGW